MGVTLAVVCVVVLVAVLVPILAFGPLDVGGARAQPKPFHLSYGVTPYVRETTSMAIVGLVRDAAKYWTTSKAQWEESLKAWPKAELFILENGSTDGTAEEVAKWAAENPRVHAKQDWSPGQMHVITRAEDTDVATKTQLDQDLLKHVQRRMFKMRALREIQRLWLIQHTVAYGKEWDVVCVADLDQPMAQNLGRWVDSVRSITEGEYDVVWPQGLQRVLRVGLKACWRMYDTFALDTNFDQQPYALLPQVHKTRYAYLQYIHKQCEAARKRGEYLDVTSCFGGMGLYTWKAWREGSYEMGAAFPDDWEWVCEHVLFHHSLKHADPSIRMGINPEWVLRITRD